MAGAIQCRELRKNTSFQSIELFSIYLAKHLSDLNMACLPW